MRTGLRGDMGHEMFSFWYFWFRTMKGKKKEAMRLRPRLEQGFLCSMQHAAN